MAAIDSDIIREVIKHLKSDLTIQSKIAKDRNDNLAIYSANFANISAVFPSITVEIEEGQSEQAFPSSIDTLKIIVWIDIKTKEESYKFLKSVSDAVISLFNREGSVFNNIDISTNTGVRFCNLLKRMVMFDYDDMIQKHYCQIVFDIVRSEGESFDPSDAGDVAWV